MRATAQSVTVAWDGDHSLEISFSPRTKGFDGMDATLDRAIKALVALRSAREGATRLLELGTRAWGAEVSA